MADSAVTKYPLLGYLVKSRMTSFWFKEEYIDLYEGVLDEWLEHYTPPSPIRRDYLIVDVGAREGDTALFYVALGYYNLRLVEPWDQYHANLQHNVEVLRGMGAKIDVKLETFKPEHLEGAAFVKFDCEGCEDEVDLTKLKVPAVAEVHYPLEFIGNGIYQYSPAKGYLHWSPRT